MIRREQGAEGSIIKMERLLSLCIIRFLSYYVLSVWGPRAGIISMKCDVSGVEEID